MNATAETEHTYWMSREKAAVSAPVEINVMQFNDAAGLMPPMHWGNNTAQDTETFILQEMYCGNVTEIYVRCGKRYFLLRDYSNLVHDDIVMKIKKVFNLKTQSQKWRNQAFARTITPS